MDYLIYMQIHIILQGGLVYISVDNGVHPFAMQNTTTDFKVKGSQCTDMHSYACMGVFSCLSLLCKVCFTNWYKRCKKHKHADAHLNLKFILSHVKQMSHTI